MATCLVHSHPSSSLNKCLSIFKSYGPDKVALPMTFNLKCDLDLWGTGLYIARSSSFHHGSHLWLFKNSSLHMKVMAWTLYEEGRAHSSRKNAQKLNRHCCGYDKSVNSLLPTFFFFMSVSLISSKHRMTEKYF